MATGMRDSTSDDSRCLRVRIYPRREPPSGSRDEDAHDPLRHGCQGPAGSGRGGAVPEGRTSMSSIQQTRPIRTRWRHRLVAISATGILALAGAATAGTARAAGDRRHLPGLRHPQLQPTRHQRLLAGPAHHLHRQRHDIHLPRHRRRGIDRHLHLHPDRQPDLPVGIEHHRNPWTSPGPAEPPATPPSPDWSPDSEASAAPPGCPRPSPQAASPPTPSPSPTSATPWH